MIVRDLILITNMNFLLWNIHFFFNCLLKWLLECTLAAILSELVY